MTNYITAKFDEFVESTTDKLNNNDDLYDECTKLVQANKKCNKLDSLLNSVAYAEIAFRFRLKKLALCDQTHGTYFNSYNDPMEDAAAQLMMTRDKLMDYCAKKKLDYLSIFA